ncbi:MAG: hypothetical protein ACM3ZT_05085 [Bacillota bacterium]
MKNRRILAVFALFVPLAACVHGSNNASTPGVFQAKFQPLVDIGPFPNDLYFSHSDGSANTTGTLSILPIGSSTTGANAPIASMDHLDGFGTQSDINIYFNGQVDSSTLAAGVIVLKVASSATTKAVNPAGSVTPLKVGTDYSIGLSPATDDGGQTVVIKPLKPLTASTVSGTTPVPATYLVIVTGAVKDKSGNAVTASNDYSTILTADTPFFTTGKITTTGNATLDQIALFTLPQLIVAHVGAGVPLNDIALTFSFSTQYLGLSLGELAATATATAQPAGVGIVDTNATVCAALIVAKEVPDVAHCPPGSTTAEIFAGDLAIPYYLPVPSATNPTAAITGFWKNAAGGDTTAADALPKATVAQNVIPVLVSIPKGTCTMPGSGWPVVIFQHGITRNREDMFGIAGTFAASPLCMATIAIDLPLHGITDTTNAFYLKGHERTFDMDLENNSTLAAGPDGTIDSSGAWFINLNSTITSRDNLREGAADLINLVATLPALAAVTPPATLNTFDSTKVFYAGHSLGGIVGTVFLGADTEGAALTLSAPKIVAATLANPGGHIAELLRNSAEFGPVIDAQLAANGLAKGTLGYYAFYSQAQAVVEDGDPANYAGLAAAGHPIHMIEVVGGLTGASDTCNLPDQVVPNSSTDLVASLMGLTQVKASALGSAFIVRFLAGDHGSFLSPALPSNCSSSDALLYEGVTAEMQTETATFLGSAGTGITINNSAGFIK